MNFWFKLTKLLTTGDKTSYDIPTSEQQKYLDSFPDPQSDFERSFFQYKCQSFFVSNQKIVLSNLFSFILFIPIIIFITLRRLFVFPRMRREVVAEVCGMPEIIPELLKERYSFEDNLWNMKMSLSLNDWGICFRLLMKYPTNPFFVLKCIMKIGVYSNLIRQYHPSTIIVQAEGTFTSSILTYYCNSRKILHINVMHGHKSFYIRDAFFKFNEFYAWDKFYVDIFLRLRAEPSQFIIALPPSIRINTKLYKNDNVYADFKYYLGNESEDEIAHISESLSILRSQGKTVKCRPHPRYTNIRMLQKYIDKSDIEDVKVPILESVSNLDYAIGLHSTVLIQAFFSGKKVIIDDITFKEKSKILKEMGYILFEYNVEMLTDYMKSFKIEKNAEH